MTEDNVGVCRPAVLKLHMDSKNIVLFKTINVKLFLLVTSVIILGLEQHRKQRSHCSVKKEYPLAAGIQVATATEEPWDSWN